MPSFLRSLLSVFLTLKYAVFRYYLRANNQTPEHNSLVEYQFLCSTLRRYPFWAKGHEHLVSLALDRKAVSMAYAAALAVEKLRGSSAHSDYLLARCFLAAGKAEKAYSLFSNREKSATLTNAMKEDYAATLMALSKYKEALEILREVPEAKRSPSARIAKQACESALVKNQASPDPS